MFSKCYAQNRKNEKFKIIDVFMFSFLENREYFQ